LAEIFFGGNFLAEIFKKSKHDIPCGAIQRFEMFQIELHNNQI
jgi:hypothetical protein